MAAYSDYLAGAILDAVPNDVPCASPAIAYVALYTTTTDATGVGGLVVQAD